MSGTSPQPVSGAIIGTTIDYQHQTRSKEATNSAVTATIYSLPTIPTGFLQGVTGFYPNSKVLQLEEEKTELERKVSRWEKLAHEYEPLLGRGRRLDDDDGWCHRGYVTEE